MESSDILNHAMLGAIGGMDQEGAGKEVGVLGVSMGRLTLALVVESLIGGAVYTFPELR